MINELNNILVKTYDNYYTLDYVFVGHKLDILDFCYESSKDYLISSSRDNSVRIWDLKVRITYMVINLIYNQITYMVINLIYYQIIYNLS